MTLRYVIAARLSIVMVSVMVAASVAAQPVAEESEKPDAPVEAADDGDEPLAGPVEEFQRQYAAWQANRDNILQELVTIRDLPIEKRRELGRRTQQSGDRAFAKVLAAAEAAYTAEPTNEEVEKYLLLVAVKSLENDQIEVAARISILLLDHGYDPKVLASVAGRASLELGDVDNAIKYLTLAQESGVTLSRISSMYLEHLDLFRHTLDAEKKLRAAEAKADDLPRVLLETTRGDIVIELFENELPNAVASFIFLVEHNFYNDMAFFQVRPLYFSASGCPNDNGTGTAGYTILKEPVFNLLTHYELLTGEEFDDETFYAGHQRHHMRGTVSMLGLKEWTCGSQFMICHRYSTMTSADKSHMALGRVIEGMNVATRMMSISPRFAPKDAETDRLIKATVIRKRDHDYRPQTTAEVIQAVATHVFELSSQDRHVEAIKICEAALGVAPKDANMLFAAAMCRTGTKDYEVAAELLERAVHVAPENPEARRQLGLTYVRLNRMRDATEQMRELTRITPDDAMAFNNLGTMLMGQQRKREAIEAFEKALELNPDYETARQNLKLLQQ